MKLVTFGVTNTLLKFRSSPGKQYGEIGALYGVLSDNNVLATNFKNSWHRLNKEHPNFGLKTGLRWEEWWKLIIKGTFENSDFNRNEEKLNAFSAHLIDLYKTSACWQQCYSALGLLSYLYEKKVPLGVISNFDPRLDITLENTKLKHYFQFILTSYDVGALKPEARIFKEAVSRSQIPNLKPEECLHIGSKAAVDYLGAKNCGWQTYLVDDRMHDQILRKYPYVEKDDIFANLYDIYRYFNNEKQHIFETV